MEETYPVLADGEIIGMLHVKEEGSATIFTARCRMQEGIVRLSVYGETGEGYLGVLVPENGELCLSRRLSRAAMRAFPKEIVEAGIAGRGRASIPVLPEAEMETETQPEPETEKNHPRKPVRSRPNRKRTSGSGMPRRMGRWSALTGRGIWWRCRRETAASRRGLPAAP